jgi:hypothetical protein
LAESSIRVKPFILIAVGLSWLAVVANLFVASVSFSALLKQTTGFILTSPAWFPAWAERPAFLSFYLLLLLAGIVPIAIGFKLLLGHD